MKLYEISKNTFFSFSPKPPIKFEILYHWRDRVVGNSTACAATTIQILKKFWPSEILKKLWPKYERGNGANKTRTISSFKSGI